MSLALEKAIEFADKGSRYEDATRAEKPSAVRENFSYRMIGLAAVSIAETFRLLARHWVWNTCLKKLEDSPWPEEKPEQTKNQKEKRE